MAHTLLVCFRYKRTLTDDGERFPSVVALTHGGIAPSSAEIEERVEAYAARLPHQDRVIDLVHEQLDQDRGFISV